MVARLSDNQSGPFARLQMLGMRGIGWNRGQNNVYKIVIHDI